MTRLEVIRELNRRLDAVWPFQDGDTMLLPAGLVSEACDKLEGADYELKHRETYDDEDTEPDQDDAETDIVAAYNCIMAVPLVRLGTIVGLSAGILADMAAQRVRKAVAL